MKKLLILAAVIVAGVAANAATFKWTAANIYGADLTTKITGSATIYAYLSTADASSAVVVTSAPITSGAMATTYDWTAAVVDSQYNFYYVIENDGKTFTSAVKTGLAQATSTTTVAFANQASATQNSANWVGGGAVPEPTSGLLMLLGMAGLALRRRRA